jgi:hypothetical protein
VTNVTGWEVSPTPAPADTAPKVTGSGSDGLVQPSAVARRAARQDAQQQQSAAPPAQAANNPAEQPKKEEKKGLFRRLIGVFK